MKNVSRPVKARKEENAYVDKNRYLGLCSYCKSAPNCTFVRDPSRPISECEEFNEFTYVPVRVPNHQKNIILKNLSNSPSTSEDPFHHYRGLCSDCEERANCVYPKPEGGVWHCEEFRLGMGKG